MKRINHALVEGSAQPDCLGQSNPKDHQGHADGRGREIAARADRGGSGAALCRADGKGRGQSRRFDRDERSSSAPCSAAAATRCISWSSAPPSAVFAALSIRRSRASPATRALSLMGQGKTVKILCVGKKGYDILRRQFGRQIIEVIDLRAVRSLGFRRCRRDRPQDRRLARGGRVRRLHAVFLAVQFGDRANSDRAANHSSRLAGGGESARQAARLMSMSRTRKKFSRRFYPATFRFRSCGRCLKMPRRNKARG